jgi:hypothetical protein
MTRLFYEKMLREEFPSLRWLRVCTTAAGRATIYVCDENLELSMSDIGQIDKFLRHKGLVSCWHTVKHYFELRNDNVFPVGELPVLVRELALLGDVTYRGVHKSLSIAFPPLDPDSIKAEGTTVFVSPKLGLIPTESQVKLLEILLNEVLPLGSTGIIRKRPYDPSA